MANDAIAPDRFSKKIHIRAVIIAQLELGHIERQVQVGNLVGCHGPQVRSDSVRTGHPGGRRSHWLADARRLDGPVKPGHDNGVCASILDSPIFTLPLREGRKI